MAKTFFELKKSAGELMGQSGRLADELGYKAAGDSIRDIKSAYDKKEMMVVAVGEARRGKSSLLNMLLNEKEPIFPVDLNVCTNVVTIVRYGKEESISAIIADPSSRDGCRVEKITRDRISDYVSEQGNPNNYKNVQCLEVAVPNDVLKDGVVFVDTPGVGSLNPAHAEVTYSFLPNADLIIFVTDALAGMTETELKFLARGYKYSKNIVFALTKKDLNAGNCQVIADDNRNKIKSATDMADEDIKIVAVSNTAKLRYLTGGNQSMYKNSGFIEFEKVIWDTVAKTRAKSVILPYVHDTGQEMVKISDNISSRLALLDDRGKTEALIKKLNEESERLEELDTKSVEWRSEINLRCGDISSDTLAKVKNLGQRAKDIYIDYQNKMGVAICKEKQYLQVAEEVNSLISEGLIDVRENMSDAIGELVEKVNYELQLDIDDFTGTVDKIQYESEELKVRFRKKGTNEKLMTKGRNIGIGLSAFTTISTVIGAIGGFAIGVGLLGVGAVAGVTAGAKLGSTVGAALGAGNAVKELVSKHDMSDVSSVSSAFNQMISSEIDNIARMVNRVSAELRESLLNAFSKKINTRKKEIQQNIQHLKENIRANDSEIPKKKALLSKQQASVDTMVSSLAAIEDEIYSYNEAVRPAKPREKSDSDNNTSSYGFI